MKRIIASAGCVVMGATAVHAANETGLSAVERTKPWSVSATLRGFYDDNYTTAPKGTVIRDSFGFELSPSAKLNYGNDQTVASIGYTYGMRYYEDRATLKQSSADHSHALNASLDHQMSERYKFNLKESFLIAQEPEILGGGLIGRANGNNIRNQADGSFSALLTREFTVVLGYANTLYDYDQSGPGSYSALLDRNEHLISLNGRYMVSETSTAVLGYQYGIVEYSSKDPIVGAYLPSNRDSDSHYVFAGLDHKFSSQLSGMVRVGGQWVNYTKLNSDTISPYADASLSWAYAEGSSFTLGVRHQRNQTDVAFYTASVTPTLDQEATTVYGNLSHKLTAKITGNLVGQYTSASFRGGSVNNLEDSVYSVGVNFGYQINQFVSAELGYNFDKVTSDLDKLGPIARGFDRSRVYMGVRASY